MAQFKMELPKDVLAEFERIEADTEFIMGGMVEAGADVVMNLVKGNVPPGMANSPIMDCLKKTKVYKTPSDDGINVAVEFYGYFINENGVKTPAPLVCNVFEYGRSGLKFPKHPFMRASFNQSMIIGAMLKAQRELSGGLLEDE
jgi:hypothetical protein